MTLCTHNVPFEVTCAACVGEAMDKERKPSKHRNTKVVVDGLKFDSQREAKRWRQLKFLESVGQIRDLQRQVVFDLVPAVVLGGRKKPSVRYIADFEYMDNTRSPGDQVVIEDSKSPHLRTDPVYRLKKHLMRHVHNLEITEV